MRLSSTKAQPSNTDISPGSQSAARTKKVLRHPTQVSAPQVSTCKQPLCVTLFIGDRISLLLRPWTWGVQTSKRRCSASTLRGCCAARPAELAWSAELMARRSDSAQIHLKGYRGPIAPDIQKCDHFPVQSKNDPIPVPCSLWNISPAEQESRRIVLQKMFSGKGFVQTPLPLSRVYLNMSSRLIHISTRSDQSPDVNEIHPALSTFCRSGASPGSVRSGRCWAHAPLPPET